VRKLVDIALPTVRGEDGRGGGIQEQCCRMNKEGCCAEAATWEVQHEEDQCETTFACDEHLSEMCGPNTTTVWPINEARSRRGR